MVRKADLGEHLQPNQPITTHIHADLRVSPAGNVLLRETWTSLTPLIEHTVPDTRQSEG